MMPTSKLHPHCLANGCYMFVAETPAETQCKQACRLRSDSVRGLDKMPPQVSALFDAVRKASKGEGE